MDDSEGRILSIRVNQEGGILALHKPLLVLFALGRLVTSNQRLILFQDADAELRQLFKRFFPQALNRANTHYPFGKLENDGIWEVERSASLSRTAAGHLFKTELLDERIHGGFVLDIFNALAADKGRARSIAQALAKRFFPDDAADEILRAVGLNVSTPNLGNPKSPHWEEQNLMREHSELREPNADATRPIPQNHFITYLNSLHNYTASGANALAESQALNSHFGEMYIPLPLAQQLRELLTDGNEWVIILSGHAGDGKSTVALDVIKTIRGIPLTEPLQQPLRERETHGSITIVKDMSELGADIRRQWLADAFSQPGSWLIVSNTGPLLHSLLAYAPQIDGLESKILSLLNTPIAGETFEKNRYDGFAKPLLILNLTRLDNVDIGARILTRLIQHSGWKQCSDCPIESACPLALNHRALSDALSVVEQRVRWLYRRISDYERRLTLRQMVAHLAFAITGGMDCAKAQTRAEASAVLGVGSSAVALEEIIFSDGFFGVRVDQPLPEAESLHAIALLRRSLLGGPVGPNFERRITEDAGDGWIVLPDVLYHLRERWRQRAAEPEKIPSRAALRRLLLIFGTPREQSTEQFEVFLDTVLRSPSLRQLDSWQRCEKFTLSHSDSRRLLTACMNVLLESFCGFSAGQFQGRLDHLYITLRRPDRAVVQPTQIIVSRLPLADFELIFDQIARLPRLCYRPKSVFLELSLPLLDYIARRNAGELPDGLSPIHQAQLERFAARLMEARSPIGNHDEIALLRAGINGEVVPYRYFFDEKEERLERE